MATETNAQVAAEAPGMPQLDFSTFPNQIFWLVVTLIVIYLVLSRVALPRIGSVFAERSGIITNDIAAAEELKKMAIDAEEAFNKALADARVEANKIVAQTKAEIQAKVDKAIAKADVDIAASAAEGELAIAKIRDSAKADAETVAKDIAKYIVAAVAPGKIDAKAVTAAVTSRMEG